MENLTSQSIQQFFNSYFTPRHKLFWPVLAIVLLLLVSILQLRSQGRFWWCTCGRIDLWVGDIWSSDNSQHLSDPYSFSHMLHGVIFFWVLAWLLPRLSLLWRLSLATFIEALWEVAENSELVIQRYREATAALGYQGDTIVNSLADILFCILGFGLAYYLGFRRSLLFFVVTELVLLFWIKDNLILNVIMLLYPIEAIRAWQVG